MAYSTVRYGSSGADVSELQRLLNEQGGYGLDVDGIFGANTQQAVRDYQTSRGLDVDGIVGNQTWGALTNASQAVANAGGTDTSTPSGAVTAGASGSAKLNQKSTYYDNINTSISPITTQNYLAGVNTSVPTVTSAGVSAATKNSLGQYEAGYTPSETVNQAYAMLQAQLDAKPGDYESKYTEQLNSLYDQITNRDKFQYDLNSDMLYQQYKDQYTNLGQVAMMDTMGQAAALTGGYGSSYSQSVGQQAYNSYLQKLNEIVPDLYQMAYQQYRDEGTDLLNQWSMTRDLDATDYARYRDIMSDYYTNLNFAYGMYNDERSFDYNDYSNMLNYWQNKYAMEQDQSNWEAQFAYTQQADAVNRAMQMASMLQDQENWNAQFNYTQQSDDIARQMQLASLMQDQYNWQSEFDSDEAYRAWQMAQAEAAAAGGSGGSYGGGGGGGGNPKSPEPSEPSDNYLSTYIQNLDDSGALDTQSNDDYVATIALQMASGGSSGEEIVKYLNNEKAKGRLSPQMWNYLYNRYYSRREGVNEKAAYNFY